MILILKSGGPKMVDVFGINVASYSGVESLLNKDVRIKGASITFVNPHSYFLAKNSHEYKSCLERMTYVFPDGIGVVKLAKRMGHHNISRVSFDNSSIAPDIFRYCKEHGLSVGFIGGHPGVASDFSMNLKKIYEYDRFYPISDGYASFDDIVDRAGEIDFDCIVVGMGSPNQELICERITKPGLVVFTCGGFMDQSLVSYEYYPKIINKLNLRFMYRLYKEPRRLWRRYLVEYRVFIFIYLKAIFCVKSI